MEHVWVEAYIDYIPSRGAKHIAGQGDTWIEMDASYKQYKYTKGVDIQAAVPFDAQAFIDQLTASATINEQEGYVVGLNTAFMETSLENYKDNLQNYLDQNYPDATIGDVLGDKRAIAAGHSYLIGTLPYKKALVGTHVAELTDNFRHKISLEVAKDEFDIAAIQVTMTVPELAGRKITVCYRPATPEDEAVINSYLPESHADGTPIQPEELPQSLPAYTIRVVPELRIDENILSTGDAVILGTEEVFTMDLVDPSIKSAPIVNNVIAGDYFVVGLNLGRISQEQVGQIENELEQTKASLEFGQIEEITRHKIIGDMFYATAILYHAAVDANRHTSAKAIEVVSANLPSETIFGMQLNTDFFMGIPRTVNGGGLFMDADHLACIVQAKNGERDKTKLFMMQSGMASSFLENSVPERLFSTDSYPAMGISAVKALEIAAEQGLRIYTIDKSNSSIIPTLQIGNDVKQEIINAVAAGKAVTVSSANINFQGWIGCGYIAIDKDTGAGAYMIDGGLNGSAIIALLNKFVAAFSTVEGILKIVSIIPVIIAGIGLFIAGLYLLIHVIGHIAAAFAGLLAFILLFHEIGLALLIMAVGILLIVLAFKLIQVLLSNLKFRRKMGFDLFAEGADDVQDCGFNFSDFNARIYC